MSPTLTTKLLCHMLIVLLTLKLAYASPSMKPSDTSKESFEEVDDLLSSDSNKNKLSSEDTAEPYSHRDEDQLLAKAQNLKNLKFDVEILESREVKHEDNELEEQFRGAAALKTDLSFDDENIEMNDMDVSSHPLLKESHLYTSILLLILAILSISIYAILVVWRSRLEQRYGMRELLITDDFDEFYRQQQQQQHHQDDDSQANNNSSNYNNNNNYNHDNANQQRGIVLENGQQPQYYLVHA